MQPLSPDEVKWAKSLGLLEKEKSCWQENPRKAIGCIAGLLFIAAVIGAVIIIAGVM